MWKRKKDYHTNKRHSGANPFVQSAEKPKRHIFLWLGAGIVLLGIAGYLSATYPAVQITDITIHGATTVSSDTIRGSVNDFLKIKRWGIAPQQSMIFFSKKGLTRQLERQFNFSDIEIDRVGMTKLDITVRESEPAVTILNSGQRLYIDADGTVIRTEVYQPIDVNLIVGANSAVRKQTPALAYPEISYLGTIEGITDQNIVTHQIIEPTVVKFIIDLHQALDSVPGVQISRYELQSASIDTLTMETVEGWRVYFKVNDQPGAQAERLKILLSQKIKNTSALDYVDLRYDDKVFYQ